MKFTYIVIAIVFVGCISAITSYITVKTIAPTLPKFTLTSVEIIKTSTQTILPTQTPDISPTATGTPTQQYIPLIASNLLQNGDFENGLEGWKFENQKELFIYETTGVSGKAICSRQYAPNVWITSKLFPSELSSFSQEINVDPLIQLYFLSAWVKLNKAINIYVKITYYEGSKNDDSGFIELTKYSQSNHQNNGNTTNGWFFSHHIIPIEPHINITKVVISFFHGSIKDPPENIDSTFCVDDIVFGKIVK